MRALGRPIFGFSNDGRLFLERVTAFCGGAVRLRPTGEHEDPDGMAIEPFELHDNLMLVGGIVASGGMPDSRDHRGRRALHVAGRVRTLRHVRRGQIALRSSTTTL